MPSLVIKGEPASKANSRQLVQIHGRPAFIKSKKARDYLHSAKLQAQAQWKERPLDGPIAFEARIYYASHRPDLDPSVLLDALQGICYANDRQVREMHLYHAIDKANPRAEVELWPI